MRFVVAVMLMVAGCAEDTNLPLGASCDENSQCTSGNCFHSFLGSHAGTCQCSHDTDCPNGQVCKQTVDTGRFCTFP